MEFVLPFLNNSIRKQVANTCIDLYVAHEEIPIQEYTHNGSYDPKLKRVRNLTVMNMSNVPQGILDLPLCEYLHLENCDIESIRAPKLKYIRTNKFYSVPVHTYDFYDTCGLTVDNFKPIQANQILGNHCMLQFIRSTAKGMPNTIIHAYCLCCGIYTNRTLRSNTIIVKDSFIHDQTFYDAPNVHFFNSSFRSCPQFSKHLRCLSWNTSNAILSDFPRLPDSLVYLNIENNFTLAEFPDCPATLKHLFMMHTGIKNQVRIALEFPELEELSLNVDSDLDLVADLKHIKTLSICYKGFNLQDIVIACAPLVQLKELNLFVRGYFFKNSLDQLRLSLPNTISKIFPCRY